MNLTYEAWRISYQSSEQAARAAFNAWLELSTIQKLDKPRIIESEVLATSLAGAVPDGWKLVPIEPTREMLDAYVAINNRFSSARTDWKAMLGAAPTSSIDGRGGQQAPIAPQAVDMSPLTLNEAAKIIADRKAGVPPSPISECRCADCGAVLELVRPGKYQHPSCPAAPTANPTSDIKTDIFESYKSWPEDIRKKLSAHDLRRMNGWAPKPTGSWGIDHSAGRPILVYENCSVIEAEQARYVLSLIAHAATPTANTPAVPDNEFIKAICEDALVSAAQIIDAVKMEWQQQGSWSEWDQSVREEISRCLLALDQLATPSPVQERVEPVGVPDETEIEIEPLTALLSDDHILLTMSQFVDIEDGHISFCPEVKDLLRFARAIEQDARAPLIAHMPRSAAPPSTVGDK